jgi:protein-S-isoprenylcysteine O-methyltransferase Ste14
MVWTRVFLLKRQGIQAMTDFLILPFAFFYFYVLFATALGWPNVGGHVFFRSDAVVWGGVLLPYRPSRATVESDFLQAEFRIGIDIDRPDKLIVDGVFAFTRNPIYVGFGLILIGEFLILPNWYLGLFRRGCGAGAPHHGSGVSSLQR